MHSFDYKNVAYWFIYLGNFRNNSINTTLLSLLLKDLILMYNIIHGWKMQFMKPFKRPYRLNLGLRFVGKFFQNLQKSYLDHHLEHKHFECMNQLEDLPF